MSMQMAGFLVGIVAIVISLLALGAAFRQNWLGASAVAADWIRDVRDWASEVVDVFCEATYLCIEQDKLGEARAMDLLHCKHRLSALADRGRFLLPNERIHEHGEHKASAYKGLRHAALDPIVAAVMVLEETIELQAFPDRGEALIGLRREFVSLVQSIIDPVSYNKRIAKLIAGFDQERKKDPTLGGLLPHETKIPTGEAGIMSIASRRFERR